MIKRIREYFSLQRRIQHEVLETLASICLWLQYDSRHNRYGEFMYGHYETLKSLSEEIRAKEQRK